MIDPVNQMMENIEAVELSDEQVSRLRIPEIKEELRRRNLRLTGKKAELLARLRAALLVERDRVEHNHDGGQDNDDDVEDDDEDEAASGDEGNQDGVREDEIEHNPRGIAARGRRGENGPIRRNGDRGRLQIRDDDDDDDEESDVDEPRRAIETPLIRRRQKTQVMLSFRDVEESLDKFSGDNSVCIARWIDEFEETADIYKWDDVHRLTYAKRLLTGSAKRFVKYERCAKTWPKLRKALKEEFEELVDSHKVHNELRQAKKKNDETYQEYVYRMLEIAAQTDVETSAVIQYIIEGINDEAGNKSILYGARTIRQLKEKFTQYEKMKREAKSKYKVSDHKKDDKGRKPDNRPNKKSEGGPEKAKRCFNCGDKEHVSAKCPEKDKGPKCFKCQVYGHIASKCTVQQQQVKESNVVTQPTKKKHFKEVQLGDSKFMALVDTGSHMTFMRVDEYVQIGSPRLRSTNIKFNGMGSPDLNALGEFETDVIIDNETYCIRFYVLSGELLKYSVLLGTDFLDQIALSMRGGQVKIEKIDAALLEDSDRPDIFQINLVGDLNELDLSHIKEEHYREEIKRIVINYKPEKTHDVGVKMKIVLKDEIPVASRPRRLSPHELKEVDDLLKLWLEEEIIRPSNSEYASPIVLVKKKDGSTRLCVDYRPINKKIIRPCFPLPLIEDQIDLLQSAMYYSTIDLKNGFFHVDIEEDSTKYTAFVTPNGQYEFLKAPFGLSISPITFQKYICAVFRPLIERGIVRIYMDDLIIPATTREQAIEYLKMVLDVAGKHGLKINWKKCKLLQERVEYLGFIIEKGTVQPSEHKTEAVAKFKQPKGVKDVQSFLGLTGYFRKFIPRYSLIARPLTNLLRTGVKFEFCDREIEAFNELKAALVSKPVLKIYNPRAETELHTDASQLGFGMILLQKDPNDNKFHPVYYASMKTTPAEEKRTSYELEVLAIVKALEKFRVYLLNIPFTIVTDCQAFTMTMSKKNLCVKVARWALFLAEFQYVIVHRPGKNMSHVDALSRNPLPRVFLVEESVDGMIIRLKRAQREDEQIQAILKNVEENKTREYEVKNDLLYRVESGEYLVVVPKSMQTQVVQRAHGRGHFGINKTEALVRNDYWFKGMREKVESVIRNCIDCILAERKTGKQEGLLNSIPKGSLPLDTYHIDHLGPIPSTKKSYRHIFVVIDAFSKFVWMYSTRSTDSDEVIKRLQKQAEIFGNPRRIISDRGTAFTSNAFRDYCKDENIEHVLITTGVPRSNGQVERVNRTVIPLLTKLSAPKPEEWYKHLETVQKFVNATPSRSTNKTPFNLLFGTQMRLKEDPKVREMIEEEWIQMFEEQRDEIRNEAKEQLVKMQAENRKNYNKRRKEATKYVLDDMVAIKRTQQGSGLKTHSKFLGPYRVTKVLRNDRYLVEKLGYHEGPFQTSASADHMKPWGNLQDED